MSKDNIPQTIYHYTTQEGLLGILNEKALWATKIHYLNDASELTEPLRIATGALNQYLSVLQKDDKKRDIILGLVDEIRVSEGQNIHVASFCTEGDLLSQWRAYGSFGSAYSIGFNFERLQQHISTYPFELRRCEYYKQSKYQKYIEKYINTVVEKSFSEGSSPEDFIENLVNIVATMKLMCFKEEAEWRIISPRPIHSTDERYNFRASDSIIIPYYSLPLDFSLIDEIIVGPCPHPDLSRDTIFGLSHQYGITNISQYGEVRNSAIPYRAI